MQLFSAAKESTPKPVATEPVLDSSGARGSRDHTPGSATLHAAFAIPYFPTARPVAPSQTNQGI